MANGHKGKGPAQTGPTKQGGNKVAKATAAQLAARKAKALAKLAKAATPVVVAPVVAAPVVPLANAAPAPATQVVGAHRPGANRTAKLAITARSIRGINRNLRLCGFGGTNAPSATLAHGLHVLASGPTGTHGLHVQVYVGGQAQGAPVPALVVASPGTAAVGAPPVKALAYGQWVAQLTAAHLPAQQ